MRRFFLLLLVLITYYLASMFRSLPLLALCGAEGFMATAAFILSRRFRAGLSLHFSQPLGTAVVRTNTACKVSVSYKGPFAVNHYRVKIEVYIPPKKKKKFQKRLKGAGGYGENELAFWIQAPYCGLFRLHLTQLKVYDLFSLFCAKKKISEEMELAVFPDGRALQIQLASPEQYGDSPQEEQPANSLGEASHEIRQVREYRTGDLNRHIHWNLSARTGKLWLKEFEQERDFSVRLYLGIKSGFSFSPVRQSNFFVLLSALVMGLLESTGTVRIFWQETENRQVWADAGSVGQLHEILYRLYRLSAKGEFSDSSGTYPEKAFMLDTDLGWYWEESLIFRFSPRSLERDIRERVFSL